MIILYSKRFLTVMHCLSTRIINNCKLLVHLSLKWQKMFLFKIKNLLIR